MANGDRPARMADQLRRVRRQRANASRSESEVSMVWASSTRVVVYAASERNSASVPVGSAPGEPPGFIGVEVPSTRQVCCLEPDPATLDQTIPGSWGEQPPARTLERAVGIQIMVERAGWEVAGFAADVGNRAVLVGHETLGVAQLLRGDDAGTSPFMPHARAAFTPSRTRWRMTCAPSRRTWSGSAQWRGPLAWWCSWVS